jgi:hypothetical protein
MPLMRRRPLLRAAAVGGGAYIAGRHGAKASQRESEQEQRISSLEGGSASKASEPAASEGLSADTMTRLKELADLHTQGVLTDEEFAQQKQRLLGGETA